MALPPEHLLLSRNEFRIYTFKRDNNRCLHCGNAGELDAHHIIERRLFTKAHEFGGYFLGNGASLCSTSKDKQSVSCHMLAEQTLLTPSYLRQKAGIKKIILPDGYYADQEYTKWLDPVLSDGRRGQGPLYHDESVQKVLREGKVLSLYTQYVKYPRTWHLPTSPGRTKDDRIHKDTSLFAGHDVIVTIKMDGENTTINSDGFVHARSLEGDSHRSQTWVRDLAAKIAWQLDPGYRIVGENLYAKHSIPYTDLQSYFYLFSVWNEQNICLSWEDTELWAHILEVPTVPVIYKGPFEQTAITAAFARYTTQHGEQEGYVVRTATAFPYVAFSDNVAKWVRPDHVQETVHNWRTGWYPAPHTINKLKSKTLVR
jgi:RNA ligase